MWVISSRKMEMNTDMLCELFSTIMAARTGMLM